MLHSAFMLRCGLTVLPIELLRSETGTLFRTPLPPPSLLCAVPWVCVSTSYTREDRVYTVPSLRSRDQEDEKPLAGSLQAVPRARGGQVVSRRTGSGGEQVKGSSSTSARSATGGSAEASSSGVTTPKKAKFPCCRSCSKNGHDEASCPDCPLCGRFGHRTAGGISGISGISNATKSKRLQQGMRERCGWVIPVPHGMWLVSGYGKLRIRATKSMGIKCLRASRKTWLILPGGEDSIIPLVSIVDRNFDSLSSKRGVTVYGEARDSLCYTVFHPV